MYRLPDTSFLQPVLDAAIEAEGGVAGSAQHLAPDGKVLRIVAHRGLRPAFLEHFAAVAGDDGSACGHALADRRRIVIRDMMTDTGFTPHREVAEDSSLRAVVSNPLVDDEGQLHGVLSVHFASPLEGGAKRPAVLPALLRLASLVAECGTLRRRLEDRARLRGSELPALSPSSQHAALASRELLALLRERGLEVGLIEAAAREFARLLPELRRLARSW